MFGPSHNKYSFSSSFNFVQYVLQCFNMLRNCSTRLRIVETGRTISKHVETLHNVLNEIETARERILVMRWSEHGSSSFLFGMCFIGGICNEPTFLHAINARHTSSSNSSSKQLLFNCGCNCNSSSKQLLKCKLEPKC